LRRGVKQANRQAFASTRRLVVLETALFAGIPVFAAIMARGIGY
jgi:uncharacterized membrane protein